MNSICASIKAGAWAWGLFIPRLFRRIPEVFVAHIKGFGPCAGVGVCQMQWRRNQRIGRRSLWMSSRID
jgi:hypothetical protein